MAVERGHDFYHLTEVGDKIEAESLDVLLEVGGDDLSQSGLTIASRST